MKIKTAVLIAIAFILSIAAAGIMLVAYFGVSFLLTDKELVENMKFNYLLSALPCEEFPTLEKVNETTQVYEEELEAQGWLSIEQINRCPGKAFMTIYANTPYKIREKYGETFHTILYRTVNV